MACDPPRTKPQTEQAPTENTPDLHGAAVIDSDGIETPITESMIRKALDDLDQAWEQECQRRRNGPNRCGGGR